MISNTTTTGDTLQKLAALLQTMNQGQSSGPSTSPIVAPGRVTPLNIKYNSSGAGATMPPPQAGPTAPGYTPPPFGAQFMSQLDPKGAATYSAVQGVSQLLTDWNKRQDQKLQSQAANIAQNLMQAIESGDTATQHDILNDKHSVKILNKVYKGWLTKAQEANMPAEPPDPAIAGFEQGIRQHVNSKGQQQQSQVQPQLKPQTDPRVVGGYRIPQSTPAQQLTAAKIDAEKQAAQQDPQRLLETQLNSVEQKQMERIAGGLQVSPSEIERLNAAEAASERKIAAAGLIQAQKDRAAYQKQILDNQGKYNVAVANAQGKADAATILGQYRLRAAMQNVKLKVPPASAQMKLKAAQDASAALDGFITGKTKAGLWSAATGHPFMQLQQQLKAAGLTQLASDLPTFMGTTGEGMDKLKEIKESVDAYVKSYQDTLKGVYPGAGSEKGQEKSAMQNVKLKVPPASALVYPGSAKGQETPLEDEGDCDDDDIDCAI